MSTSAPTTMLEIVDGLHATSPQPLSFDRAVHIRAFLLQREAGNLLIYSTGELEHDAAGIEQLGGVERQYLNHWHESMFGGSWADHELGAPLLCHAADADEVAERAEATYTFSRRHHFGVDFEVIPMPGHTPGATAFLWDTGSHRALFTGDSLYLRDGNWVAAVLESSDRTSYIASLALLRELDFDLLVPWAASADELPYAITDRRDRRQRLGEIIERLERGESS